MASVTFAADESLKAGMARFPWVSWSEVGREEVLKKEIFERYIKTGKLSDKDREFCEKTDWHPVDELPLKKSFIKELEQARKKPSGKPMSVEEFNKWCEKL